MDSDESRRTAQVFRYAVERTCTPRFSDDSQLILFEMSACPELAALGGDDAENQVEFFDDDCPAATDQLGAEDLDEHTLQLEPTRPAP